MMTDSTRDKDSPGGGWRVVEASVRGTGHVKTGKPCQDSVHHCVEPVSGALIAAVADGAGSAEMSEIGSRIAAEASVEAARVSLAQTSAHVGEGYLRDLTRASVFIARSQVESEATRLGVEVRDLSTTLILVISVGGFLASAQIGDGAVVTRDESGEYSLLTTPQRGEYANETVFLVSRDALESLQITVERVGVERLAMFTDGIQNIVLDDPHGSPSPHIPFFAPLFGWIESQTDELRAGETLGRTLSSPKFASRTDDDVTLLLAMSS